MPLMVMLLDRRMLRVPDLGQFLRIRIKLHVGWAIAFFLIAAVVVTQFPEAYLIWQRVVLGIAAVLLFFAALGVREVILNFLALSRGIPEKRVTLFIFGGVPQIAEEETLPVIELLLAMAGLLCNLIITGILYGIYSMLVNSGSTMLAALILWSAFLYLMLSLFHLIPVFPLDGGRLVRALLWKLTGSYNRATNITTWAGQGVGLLFIAGGIVLIVLTYQWFNGLVLILVGWVLHTAALQSRRPMVVRRALRGIKARDVIARDYPIISRQLSLGQLVNDYVQASGQRCFVVARRSKLRGVVTVPDIKKVSKKRRRSTNIDKIMTPANEIRTAQAEQPAARLLEQMNEWQIDYMPVLEKDKVIGIVIRDDLMRLVKTRLEVGK
jgi:Zn-dependent protease/predicted transcriptional regulator